MADTEKFYVVKQKALPEILLKVVEAKRLLDSEKVLTVQDATDRVGISRVLFTNTRTIYFNLTTILKAGPSHLYFRWMI